MSSVRVQNQKYEEDEEMYCSALYLRSLEVFCSALNGAMQLGLFDIIGGAGGPCTAAEIAAQLPTSNPHAASMIDRMLRLISTFSILRTSLLPDGQRRYSLSPAGHFFVRNKDGVSVAAFSSDNKSWAEAWFHLKDSILEGGNPYERAHGVPMYKHMSSDPASVKEFNEAMDSLSSFIINKVVDKYKGFDGLRSLVDVGGGSGTALKIIISKYPSINAINFDLPHVIREAPSHPGLSHVGGDMFVKIPSADAIMMKDVLHNWGDEECVKILKMCYEALPEKGKVIAVSHVMPQEIDESQATKYVCQMDVMMFLASGGKQRTRTEFKELAEAAGFSSFHFICFVAYNAVAVMEFHK